MARLAASFERTPENLDGSHGRLDRSGNPILPTASASAQRVGMNGVTRGVPPVGRR